MSAPAPSRIAIESGDSSRGPKRPAISAPSRAAISADSVATISKLGFSPDEFLLNIAPVKPALAIYLFCAALLAATTAVAQENCGPAVIEPVAGATGARVQEYRAVFESCVKGDETRFATRRLRIEGEELLLTVDPETLEVDPEVLRDIGRRFDGRLALNAEVLAPGAMAVGDAVRLEGGP